MQSGRGAALLLGEPLVRPWVPEQLKAVKENGAALIVDAKAHPHAGAMRDICPPAVAAAVFGAVPPILGQVGAYKYSTECRALCAADTTKCTEGEHIVRSRLHAVRASRQARL
eukprot:scaffold4828_cov71-Phaeocystis_antarctica.AAC.1